MKNPYRKTLHKLLLALVLSTGILASTPVQAQNRLKVLDPQQPWRNFPGTIEEAVLSMRPKGVYMEVGMYLTFSARGSDFSSFDTLEVELFFTLPEEAVITDSWLWVEDERRRTAGGQRRLLLRDDHPDRPPHADAGAVRPVDPKGFQAL